MDLNVQLAARHCDLPDAIKERAHTIAEKLRRYEERLLRVAFTFDEEATHRKKAKVVCSVAGGQNVVAHARGASWSGCLQELRHKIQRELKQQRARHRDHQAPDLAREAVDW